MNLAINLSHYVSSFFKGNVFSSLTSYQKKVALAASTVFTFCTACYVIHRYFFANKEIEEKKDSPQGVDKKVVNQAGILFGKKGDDNTNPNEKDKKQTSQSTKRKESKLDGEGTIIFTDGKFKGCVGKGTFKSSQLFGSGKITSADQKTIWKGNFKNNELDGKGQITYPDGKIVEGTFKAGLLDENFPCKVTHPDRRVWEGKMKNGQLNGTGHIIFTDGTIYKGEFVNNKLNGQGTITYKSGDIKESSGIFQDNRLNGLGKMVYSCGDVCEGLFVNDKLDGQGTITFATGEIHEGFFKEGKLHGKGKIIHIDGSILEANFVNNDPEGICKVTYLDQEVWTMNRKKNVTIGETEISYNGMTAKGKFSGKLSNNTLSGEGTITDPNHQTKRTGTFKNNELQGFGSIIDLSSGVTKEGKFKNGVLLGNVKITYSDGVIWEGKVNAQGLLDGKGKIKTTSGKKEDVEFKDGLLVKS